MASPTCTSFYRDFDTNKFYISIRLFDVFTLESSSTLLKNKSTLSTVRHSKSVIMQSRFANGSLLIGGYLKNRFLYVWFLHINLRLTQAIPLGGAGTEKSKCVR